MFGLAVSVPYNTQTQTFDVSQLDDAIEVKQVMIKRCEVFAGSRVVGATLLRWPDVLKQCPDGQVPWPDVLKKCGRTSMTWTDVRSLNRCDGAVYDNKAEHAEPRILQKFNALLNSRNTHDLLLFYVLSSPCDQRCTNEEHEENILSSLKQIKTWSNHALVFSNVFKHYGKELPENELKKSLRRLGDAIGLQNIFRCKVQNPMRCRRCSTSNNGEIERFCYLDEANS